MGVTARNEALAGARTAIGGLEARGGTALYDAIYRVADALAQVPTQERRVMVLLSDGRDEAASGLEPGSFHTLDEAVDRVLKQEVIVFSVGLGKSLDKQRDFYGRTRDVIHRFGGIVEGLVEGAGEAEGERCRGLDVERHVGEHALHHQRVHVDETHLQEVEAQHRYLAVVLPVGRHLAALAEVDEVVRAVPVLDDIEPFVDFERLEEVLVILE